MFQNSSLKIDPLKERVLFFKRWIENPLQLGAIAPSSKALARAMANRAVGESRQDFEYILEIGAGTGTFTKYLLEKGVPANRLICVEMDPLLHAYLKERFPRVLVVCGDARDLSRIIPSALHEKIALVVSGIPMMTLPNQARKEIIDGCFQVLKKGGKLLQFTYSPFSSIRACRHHLKKKRVQTVFRNMPPATIWTYQRA